MMSKKTDIRFEVSAEKEKEAKLYIYGPIGSYFNENNGDDVRRKLENTDAETIHVHISSPGGSAFEGVTVMNLLKNHKAKVIVHIDGMAASAASVIAMAGDEIRMPANSIMMIHRASTIEWGNAANFEKTAKDLRKIDSALAASYKNRFVGEEGELEQLLDEETYLTAEEAVAFGLADIISEEIEVPELEDNESDEGEGVFENSKDKLLAKYNTNKTIDNKEIKPEQEEKPAHKMANLFLNW